MRPGPFDGSLVDDLGGWGGAASVVGYASGFAYGWVKGPLQPRDLVWVGGVGMGVLLVLVVPAIFVGHILDALGLI